MAMTKAEKEQLENALCQAALRHTAPVEPDVDPPDRGTYYTRGYLVAGYDFRGVPRVDKAYSEAVCHGTGTHEPSNIGGSRGSRKLHSSKSRALRAARYDFEQRAARVLRDLDIKIALAIAEEQGDLK